MAGCGPATTTVTQQIVPTVQVFFLETMSFHANERQHIQEHMHIKLCMNRGRTCEEYVSLPTSTFLLLLYYTQNRQLAPSPVNMVQKGVLLCGGAGVERQDTATCYQQLQEKQKIVARISWVGL